MRGIRLAHKLRHGQMEFAMTQLKSQSSIEYPKPRRSAGSRIRSFLRARHNRPLFLAVFLGVGLSIDGMMHFRARREASSALHEKDLAFGDIYTAAKTGDKKVTVAAAETFVRLPGVEDDERYFEADQILKQAQLHDLYQQAAASYRAGDNQNFIDTADRFLTAAATARNVSALKTLGSEQRADPRIGQIQAALKLAVIERAMELGQTGNASDISALLDRQKRLTGETPQPSQPLPGPTPRNVSTSQSTQRQP